MTAILGLLTSQMSFSDGSHCITKSQPTWKMEKQTIKECWHQVQFCLNETELKYLLQLKFIPINSDFLHQNVSVCHNSWETSFQSVMVEKCDDNTFWKTCKIHFESMAINYTVRSCHTPLVQQCTNPQ